MKIVRTKTADEIESRKRGKVLWLDTDSREVRHALVAKLQEECLEVCVEIRAENREAMIEELGDLDEILQTVMEVYNIAYEDIENAAHNKLRKKGGYLSDSGKIPFMVRKGK